MQISRLFEILYVLIEKKSVTAKELSERFEVSTRTIYRDIDTLAMAGMPVYTSKGKGGGISVLDNFVLDKALLSKEEQAEILSSLQGLNAVHGDHQNTLAKLSSLFGKEEERENWIEVDFSAWGSNQEEKDKFTTIKKSILDHLELEFLYYSAQKEGVRRSVQPIRLIFKNQAWYLYAFCKLKQDFRIFRLNRIRDLVLLDQTFEPFKETKFSLGDWEEGEHAKSELLVIRVHEKFIFRIFDEFSGAHMEKLEDHWFRVHMEIKTGSWLVNYILSFEDGIVVEQPIWLREQMRETLLTALNHYSLD